VEPDASAAVVGQVEEETSSYASSEAGAEPSQAATAEVARVNSNGSLTTLATGTVAADGSYRIEEEPVGRSDRRTLAAGR